MSAEEPEEGMPPGDPSVTDPATATPDALAPSEIRHQPSVKEALESSAAAGTPEKEQRTLRGAWVYGPITVGLGILYVLLERRTLLPSLSRRARLRSGILAALITTALLALHGIAARVIVPRFRERAARYNVRRVLKLITALAVIFSVVSVLFVGWYGAALSFGLLSLILGFALQAPITSFFAWIFILIRSPYRVGDRIRIGEATGDVIDVGYLDTTL